RGREPDQAEDHDVRPDQAGRHVHRRRRHPGRRRTAGAFMITGSLGRRYAKAILALGTDHNNLDKVGADLRGLAAAMKQSPELVSVLTNPAIRRADRKKVIDAILGKLGAQALTKTVAAFLLDGERLASLP